MQVGNRPCAPLNRDPKTAKQTTRKPSADLSIAMDPQPFPRRFLGNIKDDDMDHLQSRDTERKRRSCPLRDLPQTRGFTSRDSNAIDSSRLVTDLVTVNGNKIP